MAKLKEFFLEAGREENDLAEQPVPGFAEPKVIAVLRGSTSAAILVGAHSDAIGFRHGVIDNGSGVALPASLYESLRVLPPNPHSNSSASRPKKEDCTGPGITLKIGPP